ncbi:hypothetical protein SY83_11065 [Paenibacillus swuensis]|uniref:Uncharacterized protein n=1 Tax=Paenibacillus swuensis TaxID=1178515 RepID=A0A172TID0_9BACL|nr:hypothetical protein SY83_11065 [Paenibacillus swuensis]
MVILLDSSVVKEIGLCAKLKVAVVYSEATFVITIIMQDLYPLRILNSIRSFSPTETLFITIFL